MSAFNEPTVEPPNQDENVANERVFFLAKFFSEASYAEDFLAGSIYMNTAQYFAQLERNGDGRGDPNEGVAALYQGEHSILEIGGHTLNLGPGESIQYQRNADLQRHVLCLFAAKLSSAGVVHNPNAEPPNEEARQAILEGILPTQAADELGEYCVIFTHYPTFLQRICSTVEDMGFSFRAGLVRYYDPSTHHGAFPQNQELFYKTNDYEHQSEWRLAIAGIPQEQCNGIGAYRLEIGDLSDVAVMMDTESFLRDLQFV